MRYLVVLVALLMFSCGSSRSSSRESVEYPEMVEGKYEILFLSREFGDLRGAERDRIAIYDGKRFHVFIKDTMNTELEFVLSGLADRILFQYDDEVFMLRVVENRLRRVLDGGDAGFFNVDSYDVLLKWGDRN